MQTITVNGKKTEHNIDDSVFYITTDDDDPFSLIVRECKNYVKKIVITDDDIIYINDDDAPIEPDLGEFWTREAAENFLKQILPKELPFDKEKPLYVIKYGTVETAVPIRLCVANDTLKLILRTSNNEIIIRVKDIGTNCDVFTNYDSAMNELYKREKEHKLDIPHSYEYWKENVMDECFEYFDSSEKWSLYLRWLSNKKGD